MESIHTKLNLYDCIKPFNASHQEVCCVERIMLTNTMFKSGFRSQHSSRLLAGTEEIVENRNCNYWLRLAIKGVDQITDRRPWAEDHLKVVPVAKQQDNKQGSTNSCPQHSDDPFKVSDCDTVLWEHIFHHRLV